MVITIDPEIEDKLKELANRQGVAPDLLANHLLRDRLLGVRSHEPRDDWERGLIESARPWGVSISDAALGSEGLYD